MADFNFFEPYLETSDSPSGLRVVWFILFAILIAVLVTIQVVMNFEHNAVKSDIDSIKTELASDKINSPLNRVIEKEKVTQMLQEAVFELVILDGVIVTTNNVDIILFDKINSQVPESVYVNSMAIADNMVVISGYSDSYDSVALFQHQLRSLEIFNEIFAPAMSETQGNYSFTVTANLQLEVPNAN
ncbi:MULTISPECIES: PilN domain-containing protein [unclassified Fusibacter]|uniref:PilN domain-containing protein n=1 Tax=unclassified Fusibacter TaxID=2624464 RepID=UPI00101122DB|nr:MULTISPECIES: PilN domain-containing protein [unclassified Fusibacter]MCK8058896.1 PilN domain-containing protein [Fusibacter sp. A2]NPE21970.1 PilN domain-containing protein [Fusibacter sp. A1]RXV61538.1 hypothetical protein DWB64_09005 [Fusibacter sp. A1]